MGIKFSNMIINEEVVETQPTPITFSGQKNSFKELLQTALAPTEDVTEIEESEEEVTILKRETDEAEELFSDIRVSKYVLDMHVLNK
jgi:hypothetical protein